MFFAFPHIAINSEGEVGAITRPGRPKKSCACGALQKVRRWEPRVTPSASLVQLPDPTTPNTAAATSILHGLHALLLHWDAWLSLVCPSPPLSSSLPQCLIELKAEGVDAAVRSPGLHDPLEPEYSILKQRLARRIRYEKMDVNMLDLVSLTQVGN